MDALGSYVKLLDLFFFGTSKKVSTSFLLAHTSCSGLATVLDDFPVGLGYENGGLSLISKSPINQKHISLPHPPGIILPSKRTCFPTLLRDQICILDVIDGTLNLKRGHKMFVPRRSPVRCRRIRMNRFEY